MINSAMGLKPEESKIHYIARQHLACPDFTGKNRFLRIEAANAHRGYNGPRGKI